MATSSFQELEEYNPRDEAAKIIQRAWRSYVVSFPPNVFYKIFTYRPIVDICASSPQDYHNLQHMGYLIQEITDRTGWYQRVENNNWRLFCCKSIIKEEPFESVTKKMDFHPLKMQRKEDVRKWRKRRKIEWMKRMYKEGMEEEQRMKDNQSKKPDLLTMERKTAKDMMDSLEEGREDEILDWELDELLAWTTSLNFEEYMEEWKHQACSDTSDQNKDRATLLPMVNLAHLGQTK